MLLATVVAFLSGVVGTSRQWPGEDAKKTKQLLITSGRVVTG